MRTACSRLSEGDKSMVLRRALICIIIAFLLLPLSFTPAAPSTAQSLSAAETIHCSQCGRRIKGKYILYNNHYYCSQQCMNASMPKCCICGKPATIKSGDGKYYCSQQCLSKSWPVCAACGKHSNGGVQRGYNHIFLCSNCAKKPRCFACSMPADKKLADGRYICNNCLKTAVMTQEKADELANQVRKIMQEKLAIFTDHKIEYHLVSQQELEEQVKNHYGAGRELGLYKFRKVVETTTTTTRSRQRKITTTKSEQKVRSITHSIYFLYGIPKKKFIEVAAHELAHDWMHEYYPNISNLKIKEGWAEFVATQVNKIYNQADMNRRMQLNKDKIYGDGYRMINEYIRKYKTKGLLDMFKANNSDTSP